MTGPISRTRVVVALSSLIGPAAIVLVGLALFGQLAWNAVVFAGLAVAVLSGGILYRHLTEISALRRTLETRSLEAPRGDDPPPEHTLLCPGLETVVAETARTRQRERGALEETIAGNEAILTALPDPLIMLDENRRIMRANPAAEDLFDGALAGRDLPSVLRNPELLAAVDQVLRGAEGRVVEFPLSGPVVRYFEAHAARLRIPARDGTVAIVTLHDLTALKRAEQMRADFVANASHELRTPLASLLGFIETLQGPARDDTAARARFLGVMHEQAGRMSRLVQDLLSLSRIELHEHTPPRGTAALSDVVRSVVDILEPQARDKGMPIRFESDDVPSVAGEPDELAQVFQNLIDNAIKYGQAGSPVRIAVRQAGPGSVGARRLGRPGVAVAVSDQGEGIPREHLPRLTERFYRVDTARSRQLGGTGLGLAIVKHIVNRHRGVLDIDSTPGRGSTFTVYLPALSASDSQEAAAQ